MSVTMKEWGLRGGGTHFQRRTFSAGTYFALPWGTFRSTLVVLRGVGIRSAISVAESFVLKFVRTVMVYSTLDFPCSTTLGMTFSGRLTSRVDRYLKSSFDEYTDGRSGVVTTHFINSNSPSGGMNVILRSASNLPNRTH